MPAGEKRSTAAAAIATSGSAAARASKRQKTTKKSAVAESLPATVRDRSHKKKDKRAVVEHKKDVFDLSKPIDIDTATCALCKGNHSVGVQMMEHMKEFSSEVDRLDLLNIDPLQDIESVWVSRYSLMHKGRSIFVHCLCAEMSQEAYKTREENCWYKVATEVARGSQLKCKACSMQGATIGCVVPRCKYSLHVPCALERGLGKYLLHKKNAYYCDHHHDVEKNKEAERDRKVVRDVAKGNELIQIAAANDLDNVVLSAEGSQCFEYTAHNIDSDEVQSSQPELLELQCCDCKGLCDDPSRCRCLRRGQNYTHTGLLITGNQTNDKRRILECNFRCSCSLRRCNNRVVEKGLTARLEIFRVRCDEYFRTILQQEGKPSEEHTEFTAAAAASSSTKAAPKVTAVEVDSDESRDEDGSEEEQEGEEEDDSLDSIDGSDDKRSDKSSNFEPAESENNSSDDNSDEDVSAGVTRELQNRPQRSSKQKSQQQQQLTRLRRNSSSKSSAASAATVEAKANTNTHSSASSEAARSTTAKGAVASTDGTATASSVDNQGAISEQLTWGVRTLDFIPRNSFVCEIAGQYIEGKSNPSFSTWDRKIFGCVEASELVFEYCLMCANQSHKQQHLQQTQPLSHRWGQSVGNLRRIFPVEMWDSSEDAADFFVRKLRLRARDPDLTSSSSATVATISLGATSSAAKSTAAAVSNTTVTSSDLMLRYSSDIKEYLRGQILIDSRFYGNVGSFIRRYQDVAAAVAERATRRSSPPLSSSSSCVSPSLPKVAFSKPCFIRDSTDVTQSQAAYTVIAPIQNMLIRRVVYSSDNRRNPKLALFAAQDIPTGTELLL